MLNDIEPARNPGGGPGRKFTFGIQLIANQISSESKHEFHSWSSMIWKPSTTQEGGPGPGPGVVVNDGEVDAGHGGVAEHVVALCLAPAEQMGTRGHPGYTLGRRNWECWYAKWNTKIQNTKRVDRAAFIIFKWSCLKITKKGARTKRRSQHDIVSHIISNKNTHVHSYILRRSKKNIPGEHLVLNGLNWLSLNGFGTLEAWNWSVGQVDRGWNNNPQTIRKCKNNNNARILERGVCETGGNEYIVFSW